MGLSFRRTQLLFLIASPFATSAQSAEPLSLPIQQALDQTDWATAEVETTLLMSRYLATDTVNPPGNETQGAQFIADILTKEGLSSQIVEFAPGRSSVFSRLKGSGEEGALCLFSHIDVVPAEEEHWEVDPLSGQIKDGYLWGRGALDMKGTGALQLQVFRMLHQTGLPLRRDVVLLAVADEEVQNQGIQHILEDYWDEIDCTHAINEGGIGLEDLLFEDQDIYGISVGEKGVLWIKMTAKGEPGHGSTPRPLQAPTTLLAALDRIQKQTPEFHPPEALLQLLGKAGVRRGGFQGWILTQPFLVRTLLKKRLLANPVSAAGSTHTVNVTGLLGAVAPNVVPSESSAFLDIRVLPGTSTEEMLERIRTWVDDDTIDLEVLLATDAEVSPIHDPVFEALAFHSERVRPNSVAGPVISVGFTDSVFLRQIGVHAYGLVPFMVSAEELMGMHGNNEKVSLQNINEGLRIYWGTLLELSVAEQSQ